VQALPRECERPDCIERCKEDVRSGQSEKKKEPLEKKNMASCEATYHPSEREGRAATALLLADCETWPPGREELPTVATIQAKLHELWLQDEDWHSNFRNLLAAACLENPERSAALSRYLRPSR